ncbi:MAG TPA: SurA N-terminal domain-containing protein [Xanthomonadales bacterium]|nr:SurA N-terminal domain-containing protein [Xanthomonadales bacterium]
MVLQAIRERLSGILAVFIFAILIVPFAFVGVNSYFSADTINRVARVNEVDITTSDFSQGFQNYRRRMQSLLGENFDPEQFDQPIIRRQFLDSLIDRELLAQVSLETGLEVDDETLAKAIREIQAFQVDGAFNADVYQQRLQAQGSSPQQFENEMRAQLILDQIPGAITSSAISTDWEVDQYVRLQDQKRAFRAILLPVQKPELSAETDGEAVAAEEAVADDISEDAVLAWYESHPELYRSEEQVTIEYLELEAATMEADSKPDDDILRARFEEQKARFVTPENRLTSHILVEVDPDADDAAIESARQVAESLAGRTRAGEDFATLAEEFSQDAGSAALGGDLGWVEPGFMVQAFEEGLYALTLANPISDPVQTGFGWHVIQLRDIRPAEGMSFEEAHEILLREYTAEVQERSFLEQADRLVDLIYEDPTTLETAAGELDLEVQQAGPFGRTGADGIAANGDVVKAAFSDLVLVQGAASDPIDLGENHMVILRIKKHAPEGLLPLDKVRGDVIASIQRERATQRASARAEEILAQLHSGADIASMAESQSLELIQAEAAQRTATEFAADLLAKIFLMQAPEGETPRTAIVPLNNGFAVVQLEQVVDGEVTGDDQIRLQNYRRRIANATASAELTGLIRMLRQQSEIEVFEDRL